VHGKWLECAYQANQNPSSSSGLIGLYSNQKVDEQHTQEFWYDNSFYKPGPVSHD
jgi:hypothetical protein